LRSVALSLTTCF